jgi:ABC-2 type transport system ATP-binding protein
MIEARGLTKRYGSTLAVDGLSFTVPPGVVTGFLGPNGSGKSTTMRMILGLDAPSAGRVTVHGRPYTDYRRPMFEVGALLQARAAHGGRTAQDHLRVLALSNGIDRRRVAQVLEQVGLEPVARRRLGGFSLGMSQRLGIAAALLGDPPVLIFDEPVNGLDPEGVLWVRTLVKSLAARGRTVFLSSHLMSEMAITADRLVIIGRGRLIADATVADLLAGGAGDHVLVRSARNDELTALLGARGATVTAQPDGTLQVVGVEAGVVGEVARAGGVSLQELSTQQASLEQRYMELTGEAVDFRAGDAPLDPGRADQ